MKRSRGSHWNRWKFFSWVWRACLWRTLGWVPAGVGSDVRRKTRIRSAIYAEDFTHPISSFTPRLITTTLIQNAIHTASCFWNTWCSDRAERSSRLFWGLSWSQGILISFVYFCLFFIWPTMEVRVSMLLQNCFLRSWLVVLLPGPPAGQMAGNSFYLLYNSTWGHGIRYAVKGRNGRKRNAQKKVLTKCLSVLLKILIWKFYFSDLATESFEEKKTTSKAIVSVINLTKDRI